MSHKIVLFRTEKRGDAYGKEFSKWKILFHTQDDIYCKNSKNSRHRRKSLKETTFQYFYYGHY